MLGENFILGLGPLSQDLSTVKPRVTFLFLCLDYS